MIELIIGIKKLTLNAENNQSFTTLNQFVLQDIISSFEKANMDAKISMEFYLTRYDILQLLSH